MDAKNLETTQAWTFALNAIMTNGLECSPRGMKIKEIVGGRISIPMSYPMVVLKDRKMNFKFAVGEAHWIVSGSNKLKDITEYMAKYKDYSDDGFFLNGAYGPKFVDQLRYVVDTLQSDPDSRQAVISFWRESPRPSKDIPCTLSHQYLIRDKKLHLVATMRSQDMVWGFCYDSFTFSMMAKAVQSLLRARGLDVEMGNLIINQGSAHIYEKHWEDAKRWFDEVNIPAGAIGNNTLYTLPDDIESKCDMFTWNDPSFSSYYSFLDYLKKMADEL